MSYKLSRPICSNIMFETSYYDLWGYLGMYLKYLNYLWVEVAWVYKEFPVKPFVEDGRGWF